MSTAAAPIVNCINFCCEELPPSTPSLAPCAGLPESSSPGGITQNVTIQVPCGINPGTSLDGQISSFLAAQGLIMQGSSSYVDGSVVVYAQDSNNPGLSVAAIQSLVTSGLASYGLNASGPVQVTVSPICDTAPQANPGGGVTTQSTAASGPPTAIGTTSPAGGSGGLSAIYSGVYKALGSPGWLSTPISALAGMSEISQLVILIGFVAIIGVALFAIVKAAK
jgi:hypothetical protein